MKRSRHYLPADNAFPFLGINTFHPSTQMPPSFSPSATNVEIDKGIVRKRRGYTGLGGELASPVLELIEFETLNGIRHLVAITLKKQYRYDVASGSWINITYQVSGTDVDWTGTEKDYVTYAFLTGLDDTSNLVKWLIVTNGKDRPRVWDGAAARFMPYNPDIPGFVTCRAVAGFYDHVLLGNVTTTQQERQLVIWSDTRKLLDFTGVNAGEAILTEARTDILHFKHLGDRLVIYSLDGIASCTYVGGSAIYAFDQINSRSGLVSPRTVVDLGYAHLYMAREDIYLFDGTPEPKPIGRYIRRQYVRDLVEGESHRAFAMHDPTRHAVYFVVPGLTKSSVIYKIEYDSVDPQSSTWSRSEYAHVPIAMSLFVQDSSLLWNSPLLQQITWSSWETRWNELSGKPGYKARTHASGLRVFSHDDTFVQDDGEIIRAHWDSIDFTAPVGFQSELCRWLEIELELQGSMVEVWISENKGQSYVKVKELTLTRQWEKYSVFIDSMTSTLRVRLQTTTPDAVFQLQWLRVWLRPGGPNG